MVLGLNPVTLREWSSGRGLESRLSLARPNPFGQRLVLNAALLTSELDYSTVFVSSVPKYAGKVGEFSRFYANLTPVFLQTLSLSSSLLLLALAVQLTVSSDSAAATKGISMSSPLKILNA